jgi:adenylate kinase
MLNIRFGLPSASPGVMLRDEKEAGTSLGKEADRLTARGLLVPDDLVNAVVHSWLDRVAGDGFVFDGYPRTPGQAEALDARLASRGTRLEACLVLVADPATLRSRVETRLVCRSCGNMASTAYGVAADAKCPRCGGDFSRRADDTAATLEARFREYTEKTVPVVAHYEAGGLLSRVNAVQPREQVTAAVCRILSA